MSDIAIIGGGLLGMLSARALQVHGATVRLFDRQRCGREASWAGGGILSPLYPWRQPPALNELARLSQAIYPALAATLMDATGIDPEWTQSGMLTLHADDAENAVAWAKSRQCHLEVLEPDQLQDLESRLSTPGSRIVRQADIAQIRSSRLVQALRCDLLQRGIRLHEHEPVQRINFANNRVAGLTSAAGHYAADQVLLAAGAWTKQLLPPAVIPPAIMPVRGQMIVIQSRPDTLRHIVLSRNHYLIPRRDGRILVGSTLEESGFDATTTNAARQELQSFAMHLMPELAALPVEHHWSGLRPGKRDLPLIGRHPEIANLFINAGHYRNGIVTAPGSVELLCALILEQSPPLDPGPFLWAKKPES